MNVKLFLKNPLVLMLLFLALGSFFASIYLTLEANQKEIKPNTLPKAELPQTVPQQSLRYRFEGDLPKLSNNQSVYKTENPVAVTKENALEWAKVFGFQSAPKELDGLDGMVYLFSQGDKGISVHPSPFRFEYWDFTEAQQGQRLTLKELEQIAFELVSKTPFIKDTFTLSKPQLTLQKTDGQLLLIEAKNEAEATFVTFSYDLTVNGVPILTKERQSAPIQVLVTMDGKIQKATITPLPLVLTEVGKADLTKPAEALTAINQGQGQLITLNNPDEGYTTLQPGDINEATLKNLEVVYVYDQDTKMLQPYYRFSGYAQTLSGAQIEVEVIITALPQEVFTEDNG